MVVFLVGLIAALLLGGCGKKTGEEKPEAMADLTGHTLHVYCGAGMTKPFQEISDAFTKKTGCKMEVTFANAGQIQMQINTAQEGDLFIAGSTEELKPVESFVTERMPLVKHIPVIAVQKGNPKGIKDLNAIAEEGIRVVLGDGEGTPIGKIADKALADAGLADKVNVVARTTTAPQIFTTLTAGESDAVIVWKENVTDQGEIVATGDLDRYIKEIPAAALSFSADKEAQQAFLTFLGTGEAKSIWENYGYALIS
ncbi:MAG: molybdate ABC transporter substrate-binding protein [Anaerovoracaceae bacterium]